MKDHFAVLVLVLILAGGLAARWFSMAEPIWLDECHTAWTVADGSDVVASRAADGNQPPVFFWLVWYAQSQFGVSVFSLRLVSLVSGLLLMACGSGWVWKETQSAAAACVFAGLVAFDGQFIFYATEARAYALVQWLALLQGVCFWRLVRAEGSGLMWAVFAVLSLSMMYCHYMSGWLLVAELIFVGVTMAGGKQQSRGALIGLLVVCALVAVCLVPMFAGIGEVASRKENWQAVSSNVRLWADVRPWFLFWILLPLAFVLGERFGDPVSSKVGRDDWLLGWLLVWAVTGPAGIALSAGVGVAPLALVRYSVVSWVACALFAAVCVARFSGKAALSVAVMVVASSFLGNDWAQELVVRRQRPVFRNEDWVTPARQLEESSAGRPIFLFANVIEDSKSDLRDDERFQRYLKFPLLGGLHLSPDKGLVGLIEEAAIIPMSTWEPEFSQEHLDRIRERSGCSMVVRGEVELADQYPGLLEEVIGRSVNFRYLLNGEMRSSNVRVIEVKLVE